MHEIHLLPEEEVRTLPTQDHGKLVQDEEGSWWHVMTSPGGQWTVWLAEERGPRSKARNPFAGSWRVYRDGVEQYRGPLEVEAFVFLTDGGSLVLVDHPFDGWEQHRLRIFDASGRAAVSRRGASVYVVAAAVAPGGTSLALQFDSPQRRESQGAFEVISIPSGRRRWSRDLEGWEARVIIIDENEVIHAWNRESAWTRYSLLDGRCLDLDGLWEKILERGGADRVVDRVRDELAEGLPLARGRRLLSALLRVKEEVADDRRRLAMTHRWIGEVLLALYDTVGALRAWDEALAIDPKVGIAARADALRRGTLPITIGPPTS